MIKVFMSLHRMFSRPFGRECKGLAHNPELGMSLLEILIVISIIGVIFAVLASGLMDRKGQADIQTQEMAMHRIAESLEIYRLKNRHYPSTEEGLDRLVKTRLLKKNDLIDTFGEPLDYEKIEGGFILRSNGPDQKPETEDDISVDSSQR